MIKFLLREMYSKDARYTLFNQVWRLISGPIVLMLIPVYLTEETQGYWYTFVSLAALAIFADLGFSTILLQFSAHEFAQLSFNKDKTLLGEQKCLNRMATLWWFSLKWSTAMACIAFPIIYFVGYLTIRQRESSVHFLIPWLIYGIASIFVFVNSMVLSFVEGCNSVGQVQKIRLAISIASTVSVLLFLINDFGIYSLSLSLLCSSIIGSAITALIYKKMFLQLTKLGYKATHRWSSEIMPLIWRYAISWCSGYFIFQIFTPLTFSFYGPIFAGKVGLSLAICSAIFGFSTIWITIIIPKINILVARRNYEELHYIFRKRVIMAVVTYFMIMVLLFLLVCFFRENIPFIDRLVNPVSLCIIGLARGIEIVIYGMAIYMRAHKKEPLVIPSFLSAIYIFSTTWLIVHFYSFDYVFLGFLSSFVWVLPWVLIIFRRYLNKGQLATV